MVLSMHARSRALQLCRVLGMRFDRIELVALKHTRLSLRTISHVDFERLGAGPHCEPSICASYSSFVPIFVYRINGLVLVPQNQCHAANGIGRFAI